MKIVKKKNARSTTFLFRGSQDRRIDRRFLRKLSNAAKKDGTGRARVCFHASAQDPCQEMIVALTRHSYVRPHKHHGKTESFHMIKGSMDLVFFDDAGRVRQRTRMGPAGQGYFFYSRVPGRRWHTVVPRSACVIFHETTRGPFLSGDTAYPRWAPAAENKSVCQSYLKALAR